MGPYLQTCGMSADLHPSFNGRRSSQAVLTLSVAREIEPKPN